MSKLYEKLGVNSALGATVIASNRGTAFGAKQKTERVEPPPQKPKRKRTLLSADILRRIQQALSKGLSIRKTARDEGVTDTAIRYWIKHGKLKK